MAKTYFFILLTIVTNGFLCSFLRILEHAFAFFGKKKNVTISLRQHWNKCFSTSEVLIHSSHSKDDEGNTVPSLCCCLFGCRHYCLWGIGILSCVALCILIYYYSVLWSDSACSSTTKTNCWLNRFGWFLVAESYCWQHSSQMYLFFSLIPVLPLTRKITLLATPSTRDSSLCPHHLPSCTLMLFPRRQPWMYVPLSSTHTHIHIHITFANSYRAGASGR